MSSHFPLPKIRTFRFSLHTSSLSLLKMVTIVALNILRQNRTLRLMCFCQMAAWQGIEALKQTIDFPATPSFFSSKKMNKWRACSSHRKKWIKLIPKTIGNRKRDCAWGCARRINTTWKNLQIEKHKSVRWAERMPSLICAFRSADFLRWCLSSERNLTHDLFFHFQ